MTDATGEATDFFARWSRWVESHMRLALALFLTLNLTTHYASACRGLAREGLGSRVLGAPPVLVAIGIFLVVQQRVKDKSLAFKVGCFFLGATLLYTWNQSAHGILLSACKR